MGTTYTWSGKVQSPPSLIERAAGALLRAGRKSGEPGQFVSSTSENIWRPAQFSSATIRNFIEMAYCMNSAVFACVSTYAIAFAEPPLCVYSRKSKEKIPDGQHPLYELFRRPNYLMGEKELWLYLATYKALGGNGYLHKVKSPAGLTGELWPYHQGQLRGRPGGEKDARWLVGFEYYKGNGRWEPIDIEEVIHFKWMPDPRRPWQGIAPLEPAWREVLSDNELTRFIKALLQNDAVPRTALKVAEEVGLSKTELERIKREFKEKFGGENIGDVAVLTGGITDILRIGLNMEELAMEAQRRVPEARISADLRVPAILAGLNVGLTEGREGNWESTRRHFTEGMLVPEWRSVESELNQNLVPEYAPRGDVYVAFDLTQVEALKENMAEKATWVINAWDKGVFSLNQTLKNLSEDPVEGEEGDARKAPAPQITIPTGDGSPMGGGAPATGEGGKVGRRITVKAKKETRATLEKKIEGAMADRIAAMHEAAARAVEEAA